MLRVTVLGNLGSDAELRHTANERQVAQFRVAVNQVRTNGAGERRGKHRVVPRQRGWSPGRVCVTFARGQRVLVDGRTANHPHFQRRDGAPGVGFDVWADEIQNVGGRVSSGESDDERVGASATQTAVADEPWRSTTISRFSTRRDGWCLWRRPHPDPLSE